MKEYKIKVNGKEYMVEVEEVGASQAPKAAAPKVTPAAAPKVSAAPKATPAPAPTPAAPQAPVSAGAEEINAPMPGTILNINVSVGQEVKSGEVLCILEAMKMENEIVASRDGKVTQISVTKGQSVNTNDRLIVLE